MPETAINPKSATGWLLVLIPAALLMSAIFVAWPVILGVTLLIAGGNIWQNHQWSQLTRSIDPVFQQLIVQNRGEITPLDLALKANISGAASNRYLVARAVEFGTGKRRHPDLGEVYYFVSVSTLGRIFDDSESDLPSIMPATRSVVAYPSSSLPLEDRQLGSLGIIPTTTPVTGFEPNFISTASPSPDSLATVDSETRMPVATDDSSSITTEWSDIPQAEKSPELPANAVAIYSPPSIVSESIDAQLEPLPVDRVQAKVDLPPTPTIIIIQSELAKRLDVHSSTVYKRRSEPNFIDWTRNRDPDGIAWGYSEATKEYYRVDT
jgi:hypothetical protein